MARGKKISEVCKQIGVTEQTYYRWKKEYGGLQMDQAKRLKELEKEKLGWSLPWPTRSLIRRS